MLRWTLGAFLETEGISAYALAQQLGGQTRQRAIYAITAQERQGEAAHTGLPLVSEIMRALEVLTGRDIEVWELLEWVDVN